MSKILDVREMVPMKRHPEIMGAFEALNRGESFVLVNDHEPRPLLYQFQVEHDGQFDWWPLEQGPTVWRVEIAKRKTPDPKRTVTEYLQTDHRRLDDIMARFKQNVLESNWEDARADFAEFSFGLRRHIKIEEEILFPTFEEKTGMHDAGPTFVMKMEHKDIKEFLDKITAAAVAENDKDADTAVKMLLGILEDHNTKEEHILYPESDQFLTEDERSLVVKKSQAI